jgi:hypothetical protein
MPWRGEEVGGRGSGLGIALRLWGALLALMVAVALGASVPGPASAASQPDLVVAKVYLPHPPGGVVGSGFQAFSKVVNRGDAQAHRSKTGFYLSADRRLDGDDFELDGSGQSVPALPADRDDRGGARALVPIDTPQGVFHLIACADENERVGEANEDNNCRTLRGGITIMRQIGDPPSGGALSVGNPVDEIAPTGDRIAPAGNCPISAHGQGIFDRSNCVWVTTPRYQNSQLHNLEITRGLFDCPATNPFPFEVATGFDPMWENQSGGGFVFVNEMSTSGTKWRLDGNGEVMSYSGHSGEVGGASFKFEIVGRSDPADEIPHAQARFLCSDRMATSYWP